MRYAAFLRAVNVGGRIVKKDALVKPFVQLGFTNVETFIASGNVVFETPSKAAGAMEKKIGAAFEKALGYEVVTFVRAFAELNEIAWHEAFKGLVDAPTYVVGLLTAPLDAAATKKLMALQNEADRFHVRGREVWWHSTNSQGDATFSNAVLEKTLGVRTTFRNVRTIRRMVDKWSD